MYITLIRHKIAQKFQPEVFNVENKVYVWDWFVRLFHWSLAAAFAVSYLTGEDESALHVYSGYLIAALVVSRIVWGFIGPKYARFSDFIRPPGEALAYLRSLIRPDPGAKAYLGHNPAGGWMVLALLFSLAMTCFSGLKLYGAEGHGPLAVAEAAAAPVAAGPLALLVAPARADDDDHERYGGRGGHEAGEEFWEEIHEFFANATLFLIVVHVLGVLASSYRHHAGLVRGMFTGYKRSGTTQ